MSLALLDTPTRQDMPALRPMISVREVLTIVFRYWRRILVAALIPPAIAVALLVLLPKVYRAQSEILVKTGREYLPSSEGNAAVGPSSTKQEDINSEMALLNSRAVAQASIASIGLPTLYPGLVNDPPSGLSLNDAAVEKFGRDLGVDPVKMSNIISVSFEADSPQKAEGFLDKIIAVYIAKHTQIFAGQRTEGYEDSIKKTLADIDRLEAQRTRIKLDSGIYDIVAQRGALISQRVDAQAHLQELTNNQATLKQRLAYLTSMKGQIPETTQSTNTEKSDELVHARQAMMDLRQQEASVAARYGASNPDLRRIQAQIAALQQSMSGVSSSRTNTAAAPSPLRQQVEQEIVMDNAQLAPLDAERQRYQNLLGTLGDELSRLETADLALRTTSSRIDTLNDNLKSQQARYQQARTEEQTELAKQVSVIQVNPAIAPDKAAKPKKLIFAAGGVLLGLILASAVAVGSVLANTTLASEDSIERLMGLPVLSSMPMLDRRSGPMRVAAAE